MPAYLIFHPRDFRHRFGAHGISFCSWNPSARRQRQDREGTIETNNAGFLLIGASLTCVFAWVLQSPRS